MADTAPPRCAAHGGSHKRPGAPAGNTNALKHGFYAHPHQPLTDIADIINDLAAKQAALSAHIDDALSDADDEAPPHIADLVKLFSLHGQNAARLGRLLRDQRALSGDAADGISGAIAQALDELSTELGTAL